MPRTFKPKPGTKTYRNHDNIDMEKALEELKINNPPSIRSVAKKYGIPFSVLQRRNNKSVKRQGGQTALLLEAETYIIHNLNICADWGYPLDKTDLRYIVKMYLDSAKICIRRFKNNFPGPDFAERFLKRHKDKISTRISQNIKRSRAEVCPETIKTYFTELEKTLERVPFSNIVNNDETNLTDNPGRPKVIVRRGCKYPERVRNHSKGCTSLMIAANAEGELLNPYVVYKSIHLYDGWTQNGPKGTRYNRSSSGWFDGPIFCDWVKTIAIPYFEKKTGKKILIGDNLSSHLSVDLIRICNEKDIHFVFLPANSTHLTRPLDVAFFRPMKQTWRHLLQKWKQNDGRCLSSIPKGCFPRLLKLLMALSHNAEKNICSGFRKTGIVPLNSQEVISRLPNETNDTVDKDAIDESFLTLLKEMRYGTMNITEPKKKKKLEVLPGRSVDPDELNILANEPKSANGGRKEKTIKNKGTEQKQKNPKPSSNDGIEKQKNPKPSSNDGIEKQKNPKPSSSDGIEKQKNPKPSSNDGIEKQKTPEPSNNNGIEKQKNPKPSSNDGIEKQKNPKPSSNDGIEKQKNPKPSSNDKNFTPFSLSTPIVLDYTTTVNTSTSENLDVDIQSLPMILAEDLFYSQEEICENILESTIETNDVNRENDQQLVNKDENAKKFKIKILSNEKISTVYSNKRKEFKENRDQSDRKKTKISIDLTSAAASSTRRNSAIHKNLYDDVEEILNILQE